MAEKKQKHYYWLKLKDTFFDQLEIKKLRKLAGGDTYTIIYLKLQLLSIKNDGYIEFKRIENDFVDELALLLNEEVDNVRATLIFLQSLQLIEESELDNFFLPAAAENIGKESESAERVRKHRKNMKKMEVLRSEDQLSLQCNVAVTTGNATVTAMKQNGNKTLQMPINEDFSECALQCNADVTGCNTMVTQVKQDCNKPLKCPKNADILGALHCNKNVTLEIEKEIEIYKTEEEEERACVREGPVDNFVDKSVDNLARKILGMIGKNREPTQYELALLEKWLLDWGINEDLIRFVLPRMITADNPSFRYLDVILENFQQLQIFTVDKAKSYYELWDEKQRERRLQWGGESH